MGNDAIDRRIDGTLDSVFFATRASTADEIAHLACLPASVDDGRHAASSGRCRREPRSPTTWRSPTTAATEEFELFASHAESTDLIINPSFTFVFPGARQTVHLSIGRVVVADDRARRLPDRRHGVRVLRPFESFNTSVTYSVAGTPCSVRSRKELEIRDVSVVDDPVRTGPGGAWTFGT